MRGLLMALFSFEFPGHSGGANVARPHSTKAKTITKTTVKTV